MPDDFSGYDVHARSIGQPSSESVETFLEQLESRREGDDEPALGDSPVSLGRLAAERGLAPRRREGVGPGDAGRTGSNAWALAPERTASGDAIL
ncbi:MAG: penicillin acylase family protein, partial [Gemmatimonadota bacterium]